MNSLRNKFSIIAFGSTITMFLIFSLLFSCEKLDPERIIKVETGSVSNVSYAYCSVQGTILDKGKTGIIQYGFCWSVTQNPTTNDLKTQLGAKNSTGNFTGNLTGLSAGTTYYVKAYAQDAKGIYYGQEKTFKTLAVSLPEITTTSISIITENSAQSGGNITVDGGATITARGVCWSTSQNPTITNSHTSDNSGPGSFTSSLTGLIQNTTYYVRAYATNSAGTAYGNEISFTTKGPVTDIDGNVYYTVTIGSQVWMAENLKTTKHNDGTAIPLVTDPTQWGNLTTPGYCWNNNDETTYKNTYGALYNW